MRLRPSHRLVLAVLLAVTVVAATSPFPAAAQTPVPTGGNGWSVDPLGADKPGGRSNFTYTLRPGQTFRDDVSITNASDAPLTVALYAADAYNTPLDGGYALRLADDEKVDPSPWIEFTTQQLTVQPRTRADVPFRVTVPLDARPGDHAAGIIAEELPGPNAATQPGAELGIRRRIAARLYLRVAGPLDPKVVVDRIEVRTESTAFPPLTGKGSATIAYRVRNVGNTRLSATVDLRVTGFAGRTIYGFDPRRMPELLPGGQVVIVERFTGLPPLERLMARVTVRAGGTTSHASETFWVWSWALVLLTVVLIVAEMLVRRRRKRGGEGPGAPAAEPETPAPPEREPALT